MKVLHVNTYQSGGAARSCLRLHHALLQANLESDLLVLYKTCEDKRVHDFRDELPFFKNLSTKIANRSLITKQNKELKNFGTPEELISFPNTSWDITTHPLYKSADIIQFHWVAGFLDFPSFFTKNTKPVIFTVHDFFPLTGSYHYPFSGMEKFNSLVKKNYKLIAENYSGKDIIIVSPSLYLKEKAIHSGCFNPSQIYHVPYGLSSQVFKRKSFKIDLLNELKEEGKKILLFVADDLSYKRKGFDLLEVASLLLSDEFVLLIIGNPGENVPASDRVIFYGPVNNDEELGEIYNGADLFICPSRDDNFPNTVMEALFCGIPVVAYKAGGIPEMLNDENGIVVNEFTAESLANGIKSAIERNWNRNEISAKAIEKYQPSKAVEAYQEIYQGLIQSRTR